MVKAALADTPYHFIRRIGRDEIELAYGPVREVWRDALRGNISSDVYRIRYGRRWFRFVRQIDTVAPDVSTLASLDMFDPDLARERRTDPTLNAVTFRRAIRRTEVGLARTRALCGGR